MTGYTGQLKGATDAADTLFAIERYGKTSVQELVPYIGELSSVSRIAGVNLNSLGASLSIITQTAGSTATASTQVKALFLETTKESENLKRVLSDLGKEIFRSFCSPAVEIFSKPCKPFLSKQKKRELLYLRCLVLKRRR
jgi:hypothetical protein